MPSASVVKLGGVSMAVAPWVVSEGLWERIEPLLPRVERRFRYPGRKRLPDRQALQGILVRVAHRDRVAASAAGAWLRWRLDLLSPFG
jgi:transposase